MKVLKVLLFIGKVILFPLWVLYKAVDLFWSDLMSIPEMFDSDHNSEEGPDLR